MKRLKDRVFFVRCRRTYILNKLYDIKPKIGNFSIYIYVLEEEKVALHLQFKKILIYQTELASVCI